VQLRRYSLLRCFRFHSSLLIVSARIMRVENFHHFGMTSASCCIASKNTFIIRQYFIDRTRGTYYGI
jgi:hypothetical protein